MFSKKNAYKNICVKSIIKTNFKLSGVNPQKPYGLKRKLEQTYGAFEQNLQTPERHQL